MEPSRQERRSINPETDPRSKLGAAANLQFECSVVASDVSETVHTLLAEKSKTDTRRIYCVDEELDTSVATIAHIMTIGDNDVVLVRRREENTIPQRRGWLRKVVAVPVAEDSDVPELGFITKGNIFVPLLSFNKKRKNCDYVQFLSEMHDDDNYHTTVADDSRKAALVKLEDMLLEHKKIVNAKDVTKFEPGVHLLHKLISNALFEKSGLIDEAIEHRLITAMYAPFDLEVNYASIVNASKKDEVMSLIPRDLRVQSRRVTIHHDDGSVFDRTVRGRTLLPPTMADDGTLKELFISDGGNPEEDTLQLYLISRTSLATPIAKIERDHVDIDSDKFARDMPRAERLLQLQDLTELYKKRQAKFDPVIKSLRSRSALASMGKPPIEYPRNVMQEKFATRFALARLGLSRETVSDIEESYQEWQKIFLNQEAAKRVAANRMSKRHADQNRHKKGVGTRQFRAKAGSYLNPAEFAEACDEYTEMIAEYIGKGSFPGSTPPPIADYIDIVHAVTVVRELNQDALHNLGLSNNAGDSHKNWDLDVLFRKLDAKVTDENVFTTYVKRIDPSTQRPRQQELNISISYARGRYIVDIKGRYETMQDKPMKPLTIYTVDALLPDGGVDEADIAELLSILK